MNIICRIFGHKWGEGEFRQNCKQKKCSVYRMLVEYPHKGKYGQLIIDWKIIDFDKINLR